MTSVLSIPIKIVDFIASLIKYITFGYLAIVHAT